VTVKAGVECHVKDSCVADHESVGCPLEPQALRVLLQCFTDGGAEQAVKMKVGERDAVCERFKREVLIEIRLDVDQHRQQQVCSIARGEGSNRLRTATRRLWH
jgi:hypothetical protein